MNDWGDRDLSPDDSTIPIDYSHVDPDILQRSSIEVHRENARTRLTNFYNNLGITIDSHTNGVLLQNSPLHLFYLVKWKPFNTIYTDAVAVSIISKEIMLLSTNCLSHPYNTLYTPEE